MIFNSSDLPSNHGFFQRKINTNVLHIANLTDDRIHRRNASGTCHALDAVGGLKRHMTHPLLYAVSKKVDVKPGRGQADLTTGLAPEFCMETIGQVREQPIHCIRLSLLPSLSDQNHQ